MRRLVLAAFCCAFAVACQPDRSPGGGTPGTATPNTNMNPGPSNQSGTNGLGVSTDTYLDEMTDTEKASLCAWVAMKQGGPGEYQCDEQTSVNVDDVDECIAENDLPHCKVELVVDCMESIENDPCKLLQSAACSRYIQCAFSDGNGG